MMASNALGAIALERSRRARPRAPALCADRRGRLRAGHGQRALQPDRAGRAAAGRRARSGPRCPGEQRGAPHEREPGRAAARWTAVRDRSRASVHRRRGVLPRVRGEPALPDARRCRSPASRRPCACSRRSWRRPRALGAHVRPRQRTGRRGRESHLERPEHRACRQGRGARRVAGVDRGALRAHGGRRAAGVARRARHRPPRLGSGHRHRGLLGRGRAGRHLRPDL